MSEWAAKVLEGVPRHNAQDAKSMTGYAASVWLHEDAVVDAIAKLAEGDGLVERATAALEGVTPGKPVQFHPSYCEEAKGAPFSEWDSSHDLSVILPDGKRYRIGSFRHAADAGFYHFTRQWVPEAAARIAALTAQNRELALDVLASSGQAQEAYAAQLAAEAERDALRERVARLEGALRHYRETLCEGFCGEDMWADEGHSHPEIQRDCGGCLAASVLLSAALTDGGSNE